MRKSTSKNTKPIFITCYGCTIDYHVNLEAMTASVYLPAHGRGSKRVPASTLTTDVGTDGTYYVYECPSCGHIDTDYLEEEVY